MKNKKEYVDKVYRLKGDKAPLAFMLASQHSKRFPLMHFDTDEGVNKPLRYAKNQKSPFVDDQDGNVILEPIIFEDGMLSVIKENQVLQKFLALHPQNGALFEEINKGKEAAQDVEEMYAEVDALILARQMTLAQLEMIGRVLFGDVNKMSTAELKRDVLMFSKSQPEDFMNILNDPLLDLQDTVIQMFSSNLLQFKNGQKDVHFNYKKNKKRMLTVPFGEDPYYIVASYFQSDEGLETFKMLKKTLNKEE